MMKKIISLVLCLIMVLPLVVSCAKDSDDKGAQISMYLSDPLYNFDPAAAYGNESALKVVSLIFDNLFVLDESGAVRKSLVDEYEIIENEKENKYQMQITLKETAWSDKQPLQASDVADTWERILDPNNSYECAALLFDIKGAREAKAGTGGINDIGIHPVNERELIIDFEGKIDYNQFLLNLTSYALAPVRKNMTTAVYDFEDWAKSPSVFAASGPYKIRELSYVEGEERIILERNTYYLRDDDKDKENKYVKPYRIIVDYSMTDEEIMSAYENGELFFVGDIPLSVRGNWKDSATVTDALSTHSYVLNENTVVRYYDEAAFKLMEDGKLAYDATLENEVDGENIFANKTVRQALSMAIDRDAIAEAVVFAKAATALVPYGVFEQISSDEIFREVGGDLLKTSDNLRRAQHLLASADVYAPDFMFSISVPAYDDVHMKIAEMVKEAWTELGFHVAIVPVKTVKNTGLERATKEVIGGVMDDVFAENYANGLFEVAAIDYVAYSPDAFSMLAPFAKHYTGNASFVEGSSKRRTPVHATGYNNAMYDDLIHAAFKEKDVEKRAEILHEAEELLMEDLPIIPIVFNQNATLINDDILSRAKFDYYGAPDFDKLKMKNYQQYVPAKKED